MHSGSCVGNEFQCNIGNCIPEYWRCDFYPDCVDGEDELNCSLIHGSGKKSRLQGRYSNPYLSQILRLILSKILRLILSKILKTKTAIHFRLNILLG